MTDGNGLGGTTRRPLLKLAAGGAALASVGVAVRLTLHPDGDQPPEEGALVLSAKPGSDVSTLQVPLGDDLLPQQGRHRWESQRLPTSIHSMVAFTWGVAETAPVVRIRSRTAAGWGAWQRVPHLHDLPDEGDRDGDALVVGTDLVWIGRADGVQVRIDGDRPSDLSLVLLHPARRATDPLLGTAASLRTEAEDDTPTRVPRPRLVSRSDWGANEDLRDGRASFNDTLRQVHIHHTVNSNGYARDDVPALIRGMYAYHTQSLGWSDIGYNFLVDRFGRAFVGRAGGPAKLVRGAHTLGFNATSTGISVIGNYETAEPSKSTLDMIASIAAWKLAPWDRNPRGTIRVRSEGSDRYAAGRTVRLRVIDGHRDTNDTACPGQHLYDALPRIRKRTARKIRAAQQTSIVVDRPARVLGTARLGATLRAEPGSYAPEGATVAYRWLRGEREVRGAREQTYVVRPWDVGKLLTCRVVLRSTGLDPVTQTPEPLGPATADPTLRIVSSSTKRVVTVRVDVAAPHDVRQTPTGKVTVRVGDRSRTVSLTGGGASVRFGRHRKLPVGRYDVRATYAGVDPFTGGEATGSVRVS